MLVLLLLTLLPLAYNLDIQTYLQQRQELINNETLLTIGGKSTLNPKERYLNMCLKKYKLQELDYGFENPHFFNFSQNFFDYKQDIPRSKVYQIIKDMPKGAVLHVHDMGILGPEYLLNLTYMDHIYVCFDSNVHFKFSDKVPMDQCLGNWILVSEARKFYNNTEEFDKELLSHFTLAVTNPDAVYPSITETWAAFMKYFTTVEPLLTYRPVWEQYFYDVLLKMREHNVMYVEVRSILPKLYELDGHSYEPLITAKAYKKVIKQFVKNYPDFFGARLIYAPSRLINKDVLLEHLQLAKQIKDDMPDIFAGFDLVGQEDLGAPLIDFANELLEAGKELNFFFHAGETDWYGTSTDYNLVDAILLGAKRIGHAYALPKHPLLMKMIKKKDIGVEVNVISNEVLSLVRDMRNHPLSVFIANGLPVVLSSDDPGAWGADPISFDFYVAFVGVASRQDDLSLLKMLAINSLRYSALSSTDKALATKKFKTQWSQFLNNFDCAEY